MKMSGIYMIRQIGTRNVYVGSAVNMRHRWTVHRAYLRGNKHHSPHLQSAWNKHGEAGFVFEVIEECAPSLLIEREQYYLNALTPTFNCAKIAGSRFGMKNSPEHRAKISAAQKGVPRPYLLGHKVSAETRAKIGAANKGKPHGYYGRHLPEETKRKLSEAQKGVPRPYLLGHKVSVESRAKMSAAMKGNKNGLGKVCSDEKRAKIRASNLGQKRSPEARERMRQSRLAYLAKQKGNLS